jgi:hypothetical protein
MQISNNFSVTGIDAARAVDRGLASKPQSGEPATAGISMPADQLELSETRPTKVAGTLRRAVRIQGFTSVSSERHMECAYYFDFCRARLITVRIPKSMHDSICQEANDLKVSVNKLCITRLLQRIDRKLIPTSTQKRRGRRPGAEYSKSSSSTSPASVADSSPREAEFTSEVSS